MPGESGENDALLGADRSGSADHCTADNEAADGARRRKGVPQGRKVAEAILEVCNRHTGHVLSGLSLWFVICVFCSEGTSDFFPVCPAHGRIRAHYKGARHPTRDKGGQCRVVASGEVSRRALPQQAEGLYTEQGGSCILARGRLRHAHRHQLY